jgi:hypothetical protein
VSEVGIWIGEVIRQASYSLHTDNVSEKYIFLHVLTFQGNYLLSASMNIIKCHGNLYDELSFHHCNRKIRYSPFGSLSSDGPPDFPHVSSNFY